VNFDRNGAVRDGLMWSYGFLVVVSLTCEEEPMTYWHNLLLRLID
jgi:hypothetical protein